MIPGIMSAILAGGVSGPATLSYRTIDVTPTGTNPYTFSALDLGAVSGRDIVALGITWDVAGTARTLTGVTIDGVTAVRVAQGTASASGHNAEIWQAPCVNATGDAVLTFSGAVTLGELTGAVWAIGNLQSTTALDGQGNMETDPANFTVNMPAGGVAVGVAIDTGNTSFTVSGFTTENYDADIGGASTCAASGTYATADAALVLSLNFAASAAQEAACVAIWR